MDEEEQNENINENIKEELYTLYKVIILLPLISKCYYYLNHCLFRHFCLYF